MLLKNYLNELFDGRILYDELSSLDENVQFADQLYSLQEDLLQVDSKDKRWLLDVGWYPEFNINGSFKVLIIEKYNWEKPLLEVKASDIKSLKAILQECKLQYGF